MLRSAVLVAAVLVSCAAAARLNIQAQETPGMACSEYDKTFKDGRAECEGVSGCKWLPAITGGYCISTNEEQAWRLSFEEKAQALESIRSDIGAAYAELPSLPDLAAGCAACHKLVDGSMQSDAAANAAHEECGRVPAVCRTLRRQSAVLRALGQQYKKAKRPGTEICTDLSLCSLAENPLLAKIATPVREIRALARGELTALVASSRRKGEPDGEAFRSDAAVASAENGLMASFASNVEETVPRVQGIPACVVAGICSSCTACSAAGLRVDSELETVRAQEDILHELRKTEEYVATFHTVLVMPMMRLQWNLMKRLTKVGRIMFEHRSTIGKSFGEQARTHIVSIFNSLVNRGVFEDAPVWARGPMVKAFKRISNGIPLHPFTFIRDVHSALKRYTASTADNRELSAALSMGLVMPGSNPIMVKVKSETSVIPNVLTFARHVVGSHACYFRAEAEVASFSCPDSSLETDVDLKPDEPMHAYVSLFKQGGLTGSITLRLVWNRANGTLGVTCVDAYRLEDPRWGAKFRPDLKPYCKLYNMISKETVRSPGGAGSGSEYSPIWNYGGTFQVRSSEVDKDDVDEVGLMQQVDNEDEGEEEMDLDDKECDADANELETQEKSSALLQQLGANPGGLAAGGYGAVSGVCLLIAILGQAGDVLFWCFVWPAIMARN